MLIFFALLQFSNAINCTNDNQNGYLFDVNYCQEVKRSRFCPTINCRNDCPLGYKQDELGIGATCKAHYSWNLRNRVITINKGCDIGCECREPEDPGLLFGDMRLTADQIRNRVLPLDGISVHESSQYKFTFRLERWLCRRSVTWVQCRYQKVGHYCGEWTIHHPIQKEPSSVSF